MSSASASPHSPPPPRRPVVRLAIFAALLLAGLGLTLFTPLRAHLTMESMQALASRMGWWGPVALFAVGAVGPVLFLPRWPVCVLAGMLYGLLLGTGLALASGVLGAWIHFVTARWLVADSAAALADRLRGPLRWLHPDQLDARRGFWAVLVLRLVPFSNSSTTNLLAGALRMRTGGYVLATVLGMIPSTFLYVVGGKVLKQPDPAFYAVAVGAFGAAMGGAWFAQRWLSRRAGQG